MPGRPLRRRLSGRLCALATVAERLTGTRQQNGLMTARACLLSTSVPGFWPWWFFFVVFTIQKDSKSFLFPFLDNGNVECMMMNHSGNIHHFTSMAHEELGILLASGACHSNSYSYCSVLWIYFHSLLEL